MTRRCFFSFHYKDVWRANVVRNSWLTKPNTKAAGFIDKAGWEKIKRDDAEIRKWIEDSLIGTSVTAVLIGEETCNRPWVRYEVQKSYERGNGILGIYIHNISIPNEGTCNRGKTDFGVIGKDKSGGNVYFNDVYPTYWWAADDGYNNFGKWVEKAAKDAGK